MKLAVSYDSSTSTVHSYEVLACLIDTRDVPDCFMIVMTVKSKQEMLYITRSIEVSVIALAVSIQSLPQYTHCIEWRVHKVRYI